MKQEAPGSTENRQVVNLVQAMLGGISRNVRAVSLVCTDAFVELNFVLERERPEDREDIEDIVFEFEALQSSNIKIEPTIKVSADPLETVQIPGRMVYLRKEP